MAKARRTNLEAIIREAYETAAWYNEHDAPVSAARLYGKIQEREAELAEIERAAQETPEPPDTQP